MNTSQQRVLELLERWQDLAELGREPSVAELCSECPELREEVQRQIDFARGLDRLAGAKQAPGDTRVYPMTEYTPVEGELPNALSTQPVVPHYTVLGELGAGGMGVVYKARDQRLGRVVALKVIRDGLAAGLSLARFQVEAETFARLNHPHIVQVYEIGQWQPPTGGPLPYLALELVSGESLERHLGEQPAEPREAARLLRLLARAVQAMHRAGIVHRDLKPANVIMAPAADEPAMNCAWGCPKLTDFGLARRVGAEGKLTATGHVMGTPAYMAPEQASGLEAGPAADVYALGAILYRVLSGRIAFDAPTPVELMCKVIQEAPAPLPGPLGALALRCMDKSPSARPTASELIAEFDRFLAERLEETRPLPVTAPTRPLASRRWLLAAGMVALLALLAWGAWHWGRPSGDPGPGGPEGGASAPLEVEPLSVLHFERDADGASEARGALGKESFITTFGDQVSLRVSLARRGYFYLVAFNADGKEQLLWPADENNRPQPDRPPPAMAELRFPLQGKRITLNDEPRGGAQVFVVVASVKELPSWEAWRKARGAWPWKRQGPLKSVWQADVKGVYEMVPGRGPDRGAIEEPLGAPPLAALCRALAGDEAVVVEAIAFGVRRKEES